MIELTDSNADLIAARFRALAEPTRLRLLNNLRQGELSVGELADRVGAGQANVSKHLDVLFQQGFVERRKEGTTTWYRAADISFELCSLITGGIEEDLERRRKLLRPRRG